MNLYMLILGAQQRKQEEKSRTMKEQREQPTKINIVNYSQMHFINCKNSDYFSLSEKSIPKNVIKNTYCTP